MHLLDGLDESAVVHRGFFEHHGVALEMHSPARRNPGRGTDHRRRVEATAEEASHRPRRLKASSYGRIKEIAELLRVVLLPSVTDLRQGIHIPVAPHLEAPLLEYEHVRWRKTAHPPIKRRVQ